MESKILYLYASLAENGMDHIESRKLLESLSEKHRVTQKYAIIKDEHYEKVDQPSLLEQTISESDFKSTDFEVLIIEGRLGIRSEIESEKVSAKILKDFYDAGGIILFMFSEVNEFDTMYNTFLQNAVIPTLRTPKSQGEFPGYQGQKSESTLIHGFDDINALREDTLFKVTIDENYKNNINVSVREALNGISTLVVSYPIQVKVSPAKILLTGNSGTTKMLSADDLWWDGDFCHIPASYYDRGQGLSAIFTGNIFDDMAVTSHQTDAIQYFHNLLDLFLNQQRARRKLLNLPQVISEMQLEGMPKPLELDDEAGEKYERLVNRTVESIHESILQFSSDPTQKLDSENFLQLTLKKQWDGLEPESRKFLTMGEAIFRIFKDEKECDLAAAAIEYAKCIENEINSKIIRPFKNYLISKGIAKELKKEWDSARYKGEPKLKVIKFITGSIFTLGGMRYFFMDISKHEKVYAEFKKFIGDAGKMDFWLGKAPEFLYQITTKYRNGSAHTKVMTFDLCNEWRSLLLGLDAEEGMISQFMQKLPVNKKR